QDQARSSAAELAIEAAIPRPEPANVPPPTASDIKLDTTATVQDAAKEPVKAEVAPAPDKVETKPSDVATTPAPEAPKSETAKTEPAKTEPAKSEPAKADTATATPAAPVAPAAAPAAEPVKAASNVPAADQPVADKLKDIIGANASRYFDRKNERAAIEKFYGARDFAPVWTQAGSLTTAAKGVIARLKDAASDGLNPADYPLPDFATATTPDALANAELKLTASMFDYARQAQSGRMHWSQVSGDILYPEHPVDPNEVLAKVTTAADASAALDSYNPPQKLYKELKAKLAELRGQGNGPVIEIADGPTLKYTPAGKKQAEIVGEDPRVPQLRAKLGLTENANDTRYDAAVAEAVRKFQNSAELKATGILDDKTVRAINTPKRDKQIDVVLV
ncbi:MAG: peptidoglycan-binding protein, partial [Bradyrhizobium sp.]|nr:peptidoglycan-binding protein [Bradyrhizobium sp.]